MQVNAEQLFIHPSYSQNAEGYAGNGYDIALIKLRAPLNLDNNIKAIKLPNSSIESTCDAAGQYATISGWGLTETGPASSDLLKASIPITPGPSECGETAARADAICGLPEDEKDACKGDSGGSLAIQDSNGDFYQLGLVSFGPSECKVYTKYIKVNT